jgi:small subunit ribosomal protein S8
MLLKTEGYFSNVRIEGEGTKKVIHLFFADGRPPLILKRVSTPGRRVYMGKKELKPVLRGMGLAIVTTSQGLMTDREAREKGVGGEVLCTVS